MIFGAGRLLEFFLCTTMAGNGRFLSRCWSVLVVESAAACVERCIFDFRPSGVRVH